MQIKLFMRLGADVAYNINICLEMIKILKDEVVEKQAYNNSIHTK